MSLNKQINETVEMARRKLKARIDGIMDFEDEGEYEQTKEESDLIISQHKWLCEHFQQVPVNPPGTRMRMGWSEEALAAMSKNFA